MTAVPIGHARCLHCPTCVPACPHFPSHTPSTLSGQARSLFIQTQSTPNPQSLMFLPGKTVMENGSKMFPNARSAMVSPLATRLFTLDGVSAVLFGSDFITVTKKVWGGSVGRKCGANGAQAWLVGQE